MVAARTGASTTASGGELVHRRVREGRVDGAGWSCRLARLDGGALEFRLWWAPYVAGGWRWVLPVANRPSLVR